MGSLNLFMLKTEARTGAEEELADYFIKVENFSNILSIFNERGFFTSKNIMHQRITKTKNVRKMCGK